MRCGVVHDGNAQIHMFIANISQFLAVNLSTGGAFMNSSGKCVLFLDAPALHKHVDRCRASKCWGETWPILGLKVSLVASSDRRGKVKLALKRTFVLESL